MTSRVPKGAGLGLKFDQDPFSLVLVEKLHWKSEGQLPLNPSSFCHYPYCHSASLTFPDGPAAIKFINNLWARSKLERMESGNASPSAHLLQQSTQCRADKENCFFKVFLPCNSSSYHAKMHLNKKLGPNQKTIQTFKVKHRPETTVIQFIIWT